MAKLLEVMEEQGNRNQRKRLDDLNHAPPPEDRTKVPRRLQVTRKPRVKADMDPAQRRERLLQCTQRALDDFYAELFRTPSGAANAEADDLHEHPATSFGPVATKAGLASCLRSVVKAQDKAERHRALIHMAATCVAWAGRLEAFGK